MLGNSGNRHCLFCLLNQFLSLLPLLITDEFIDTLYFLLVLLDLREHGGELFGLSAHGLQLLILLLVATIQRLHLELIGTWRDQLFFEHPLHQFTHLVTFARQELLLQLDGPKELSLVEFGRTNRERVFVLPLIAAIIAHPTNVFQSQLAFLGRRQAMQLEVDFLRVYADSRGPSGRETSFLHHFGGITLEFLEQLDFSSAVIMLFIGFFFNKEDIVVAFANEGILDLFTLQTHEDLVLLLFFHLVGQWLLLLLFLLLLGLLAALFLVVIGTTGCFLSEQVFFQGNYHIFLDIIRDLAAGSLIHVMLLLFLFGLQLELPQLLIDHF